MSLVTPKLGLTKPAGIEQFNLALYNTNLDLTDAGVLFQDTERKKMRHAEWTGGAIGYPNSAAEWGVGVLTADTGSPVQKTHNNTFVSYNASDTLKILETGIYFFQWQLVATSLPPTGEVAIKNLTTGDYVNNGDLGNGKSWIRHTVGASFCTANDVIQFVTFNRMGAFSGTSRIKVTKLQGA